MTTTKTKPLLAFHGDTKIKRTYLSRVRAHRKADEIASGFYWEKRGDKMMGCAVGCILHSNRHENAATELGIPPILARLLDRFFESLWNRDREFAKALPERFIAAPKPGADLSLVWAKWCLWMLLDEKSGVINFTKREKSIEAIKGVGALYRRWAAGDKPATSEWESAKNLAAAAYAYADAAYDAAAAAAYDAAADAAYDAYADAAYDAAAAAAYDAAADAAYDAAADAAYDAAAYAAYAAYA